MLVAILAVVVMLRLYPLVIRGLLRLSARRAGATGFVALAGAARTSLTGVLPAFALVLALSLAAFAGTLRNAIASGEVAASWQATGRPPALMLVLPPATFAPLDNFCREAEQCAECRIRRARRSTVCPGYSARWNVLPGMKRSRSLHLPSPGHTSGSVSTYPGRCEVIQSLVAVVGMMVRSGMSNTSLRSMCSALGMT